MIARQPQYSATAGRAQSAGSLFPAINAEVGSSGLNQEHFEPGLLPWGGGPFFNHKENEAPTPFLEVIKCLTSFEGPEAVILEIAKCPSLPPGPAWGLN